MGDKVGENPAALRAAVFLLSAKNRRGGCSNTPPPAGRRLTDNQLSVFPAYLFSDINLKSEIDTERATLQVILEQILLRVRDQIQNQ